MDQIFYVLAIMGCGDDAGLCQQARVEPVRYTSVAACQDAMPVALHRNADLSFPVISATCRRDGPQWAKIDRNTAQKGG
ncbi:hypothetical protein [Sphingomonas xinjiangensis]|uniref:Uncharacterized protein n=1 Tax=Sphingomonas xinjiangensis TaxID=643568 RepID=A0A840YFK6_9SPHN|nr:hypothetical protein [Sphingomonas xinjiangensis]MBB5711085.1 hypothetical protein [Sphingomonas xinjiangensis]